MRESILCSRCPPRRGNPNRPELAHLTATKWNSSDDLFRGIGHTEKLLDQAGRPLRW